MYHDRISTRYFAIIEGKSYWVATDCFDFSAVQVALVYKLRWDIESFFAWWKKHLKVFTFLLEARMA